jgi:predicted acyltransferase
VTSPQAAQEEPERTPAPVAVRSPRLESLDVLRGLAIAGMILVNDPGDAEHVYGQLEHALWNGLTLADLVFPAFVFVMGCSLALALAPAVARGASLRTLWPKLLRRTLILAGLGLFLNLYPVFHFADARFTGVLQRIALAYAGASLVFLLLPRPRDQALVALLLVGLYEGLLSLAPTPGYGPGLRTPQGNFAAFVDRSLLGPHLPSDGWDPEGLLGTLPTIATALLGTLTAAWMRVSHDLVRRSVGLLLGGGICVLAGLALDPWIPINKGLWSASFVLVTGGIGMSLLGVLHGVVDQRHRGRWAFPLRVLGMNPITIYVLSSLLATTLVSIVVTRSDGSEATLQMLLVEGVDRLGLPAKAGSLAYAVLFVAFWTGVAIWMYRRRIFIKI